MKSFLVGTPELRLGLNEDLVVGRSERTYGGVVLDSVNFHESINYSSFDSEKTLFFRPPDGEFVVMNYRITSVDYAMPFRILPTFDNPTPYSLELTLNVRSDFPQNVTASTALVSFAVPKMTTSVGVDFRGGPTQKQSYEYKQAEKMVSWLIRDFGGGTEHVCKARISFAQPTTASIRREVGPITMTFEIPAYIVSGVNIRFLKIEERAKYNSSRWVRNITQANSYVVRLN